MGDNKIKNMEEFALKSGISRPTVSKYFHDPDSVRASTRARIEAALEKYDYRPNIFAMNQNRQLTKNIGIVVPYLADPVFAEIARMIERLCIDAGYWPTLLSSHGEKALEIENLNTLRSLRPVGALIAPLGRISDQAAIEDFCRDVPTVLIDRNLDGVGDAFVGSDNHSFVSQTVDYLVRTGEAPCFFEMEFPVNPNAHARRQEYHDKMNSLGLEPKVVQVEGDGWGLERIGQLGALKAIEERLLPSDTILCSNDRLAIGFLSACYKKGLRVGSGEGCSLRVASLDDHPYSRFTCPALTTAAHDYDSVTRQGFETLLEIINSGTRPETRKETLFPARLVMRASA